PRTRTGHASQGGIQQTLTIEAYDDFSNIVLAAMEYRNTGQSEVKIDQAVAQSRRLNAALGNSRPAAKVQPDEMWSFHGSSYEWGKDDVIKLSRGFSQPNVMGEMDKGGYGGGIPVVAFWTGSVGVAIGHGESLPAVGSIPVKTQNYGRMGR